jgi:hypothetical protein
MGWDPNPTDWILKISFKAPAGQLTPLPRAQTSSVHKRKKDVENHWESRRIEPYFNKLTVAIPLTHVIQHVSRLVDDYQPGCTILVDRGGWCIPYPVVYPPNGPMVRFHENLHHLGKLTRNQWD